ncbi:MAG: dihydroneopterin aldolase [Candidatus Krumholzibacteriia bacterium]
MDRIRLQGIDVYAHHGVHPAERELGQRFVIDVKLWLDLGAAASEDSLRHALDYTAVHRRICEVAAETSFQLIEALARHLCQALLLEFPVERAEITVQKPNPPIPNFLGKVSVTFARDRGWLDTADEEGR